MNLVAATAYLIGLTALAFILIFGLPFVLWLVAQP